MSFFIREIMESGFSKLGHKHFVRFGKGDYKRRFLIKYSKGKNIKIQSSFELVNDFVNFVREIGDFKFSGTVLMRNKIEGMEGKKKKGSFAYEISDSGLEGFENAYYYLLNVSSEEVVLKIKKSIPKPGKSEEKIDDKFCTLVLDLKHWDKIKELFFWDVPDCKKVEVEHEVVITEIVLPEGESNPAKMRELAKRKGKIIRKITADGKETVNEKEIVV